MANRTSDPPYLKCLVNFTLFGPTEPVNEMWAADALRILADRFDRREFVEGYYEIHDRLGMPIGFVYFHYFR